MRRDSPFLCIIFLCFFFSIFSPLHSETLPGEIMVLGIEGNVPYEYLGDDGEPVGILVDFWDLWSDITGVEVRYRFISSYPELPKLLKEVDDFPIVLSHQWVPGIDETDSQMVRAKAYYSLKPVLFYHKELRRIQSSKELSGFIVGLVRGSGVDGILSDLDGGFNVRYYDSRSSLVDDMIDRTIHLSIDLPPSMIFAIGKTGKARFFRSGIAFSQEIVFSPLVVRGDESLPGVINRGFEAISEFQRLLITRKWTGFFFGWSVHWSVVAIVGILLLSGMLFSVILFYKNHLELRIREATDELLVEQKALSSSRDALQAALKAKEILLKEVHHRVKNNLQVISSLTRLIKDNPYSTDPFTELQGRVLSIAKVHELIYMNDGFEGIQLDEMVREIASLSIESFQHRFFVDLKLECDDTEISIPEATTVTLILHELISNAFKHAFSMERDNHLVIRSWSEETNLTILVKDNGPGFPEEEGERAKKSLGLFLVKELSAQLKGSVELKSCNGAEVWVRATIAS